MGNCQQVYSGEEIEIRVLDAYVEIDGPGGLNPPEM